ncbi:MAG: hypothetical protein COB07_10515 [Sulfurovum sp.]|nr:MAG: hypothetical protein COB07_10515 [Sulfurovum sp.]
MLEIASEIIVCLLIAAAIGAAIGYLVCKSLSEKTDPAAVKPHREKKAAEKEKEVVAEKTPEKTLEETPEVIQEVMIEEVLETEEISPTEEVEIPTEDAIEKALEALEEIDVQDDEIPEAKEEPAKKPELLSSPRNGKKDALTKIKGLGPKLEEKLNTAGIYHFDQIASWTEADFEWLGENTTFASRAKKDDWVAQAKSFI